MRFQPKGIIGIKTEDGKIVPVLDFQTQKWNRTVFTTIADMQKKAVFDFFYRDQQSSQWSYLDSLPLHWIPPANAGDPDLMVNAQTDELGNLSVYLYDSEKQKPVAFVLAADALSRRCRQLNNACVPGREEPPPEQVQVGAQKRRIRWILLFLFLPILVLVVVFSRSNPLTLPWPRSEAMEKQEAEHVQETENGSSFTALNKPQVEEAKPGTKAIEQAESPTEQKSPHPVAHQKYSPTETNRYQIIWGDTLWRISERFYGERWLYPELAEINRLQDPDFIIAGHTLYLPFEINGRRRTSVEEKAGKRE